MTQISIYSKMADDPGYRIATGITDPTWEGEVEEVRDLEDVFRYFNRVDEGDGLRLEAIGYRLPSLSVGDVVTIGGVHNVVASAGFREIGDEDFDLIKRSDNSMVMRLVRGMS